VISVVVPVLNEVRALPATLAALGEQGDQHETIVVDGGSDDGTVELLRSDPALRLVESRRGRGAQMNAGAAVARGDVLVFLHADTRLPPGAIARLDAAAESDWQAGAFSHRFAPADWRLHAVSLGNNLRCRWSRIYFGDQAIFVRRALFERVGGFPDVPILEDVIFCERLRPLTRAVLLPDAVVTDSRRFLHHGVWRTIWRGTWILGRHRLGFAPGGEGYSDVVR
jgi:rSAM/selenodomain-associated transferase 2